MKYQQTLYKKIAYILLAVAFSVYVIKMKDCIVTI